MHKILEKSTRYKFNLPRIIKSKDGDLTIVFKKKIKCIFVKDDYDLYFKSVEPRIFILLKTNKVQRDIIFDEVSDYIIDQYKKILNNEETEINNNDFISAIESVTYNGNSNENILTIGYKDNYIEPIVTTTIALNKNLSNLTIKLDKNIDLIPEGKQYNDLLNKILTKVNKCNYVVMDIPNILVNNEYSMYREILNHIDKLGIPVLILTKNTLYDRELISKKYGEKFSNKCVDRLDYIYLKSNRILDISRKILFEK